jgi:hypothetical protein
MFSLRFQWKLQMGVTKAIAKCGTETKIVELSADTTKTSEACSGKEKRPVINKMKAQLKRNVIDFAALFASFVL